MTTSEERSSGGLIGSVGVVTTDNGKISIGDFRSNKECIPYGAGDPTKMNSVFSSSGALKMSFDIRDLAVYPDTSRVAEGMQISGSAHHGDVTLHWMVCSWLIRCFCRNW